jgi:hypothetical protein
LALIGTPLTLAFDFPNITGDYVAAGDGLRGATTGSITISGITPGATISAAHLYLSFLDNGESASLNDIVFAGSAKVGTKVGSGPDTCWGRTDSHTYRADVTAEVTGDGTYALTGVATGGDIFAQGATLVVVYTHASLPLRDVQIYNGNNVLEFTGIPLLSSFSGFDALGGAGNAKTTYVVGDGQPVPGGGGFEEGVRFATISGGLGFTNDFAGADGTHWDTRTHDVSSAMPAGTVAARAAMRPISVAFDCLQWSAQFLSVRTGPPSPGTDGPEANLGGVLGTAVQPSVKPVPAAVDSSHGMSASVGLFQPTPIAADSPLPSETVNYMNGLHDVGPSGANGLGDLDLIDLGFTDPFLF